MLAGNSDRERAIDVLRAAFAEGRLTKEEYDQRTERAVAARSITELQQLTSDVPHGPGGATAATPAMPTMPGMPTMPAVPQTFHGPHAYPRHAPYYGPVYPYPPPRITNSAATGALICGLITPVTFGFSAIPAVVLGHKARAEIRRTGEHGDGSAVAGIVLGWVSIGLLLLMVLLA
ncbi:DUF1707 and DUF4190 domain-containing protein [Streptomyces oceani]|uniref:Uncharacterized protein n=1 Tax=Streptomyces oceani TaxID=1075402 RepID=A0A1E7KHV3_9ACTN|nr:DUF1707 and DUF4190 domain-containing protein [Streptomyces oceani]OEV03456.1 hypothetical protein AN216_11355 [Streptomyces oceani]